MAQTAYRVCTEQAELKLTKRHTILKYSVCLLLIASSDLVGNSLAQAPAFQARLGGQWTVNEGVERSEPVDRQPFFAVAESYLTATGESFRDEYEPVASCPMAGTLADQSVDFEIIDQGDFIDIVAFGRMRRVYMDFELGPPQTFVPNPLGWSVGRWVGDMLMIKTTRFTEGVVRSGARPLPFGGPSAQMVERYTLSEDQSRLSVTVNLNDPKYYLYSVRVRHHYVRAENILLASDCSD